MDEIFALEVSCGLIGASFDERFSGIDASSEKCKGQRRKA